MLTIKNITGRFKKRITIFLLPAIFLFSCTNNKEPDSSDEVDTEAIYFDYQVRGEEGNDYITVLLQFRYGGENGGTLTLEEPGKVELDGQVITPDSSKITGTYYEIQKPIEVFTGKHSIVFTGSDKKIYKNEFDFQPLSLTTTIGDTLRRSDLLVDPIVIGFNGLAPEDYIRVLLTDTSFTGDGINRLDTARDGQLLITKKDFQNLINGPVQLEFVREHERRVKNGTGERGKLMITYSLKREFILKD